MPTSTVPFDVLFEFTNDTTSAATIQLSHGDGEFSGNATVLLQGGESVSLVLNAGTTYHYMLKQRSSKARISWVLTFMARNLPANNSFHLAPG